MGSRLRWSRATEKFVKDSRVDAFLDDVKAVCQKHGLAIGHEDSHGAFEIHPIDDKLLSWLDEAITYLPQS